MKCLLVTVFAFICTLVSCDAETTTNSSLLDSLKDLDEGNRQIIEPRLTNLTEAIEEKWDIVREVMDEETQDSETVTEILGVDADGCDRKLKKQLEDRCDEQYEKVFEETQLVEDENKKTEEVCCALEDFEKCSLRAYDKANCVTDKDAIKENLKAARLFLSVIANISCSQFRGQCAYYSAASTGYASYAIVFGAPLVQLAFFMLVF